MERGLHFGLGNVASSGAFGPRPIWVRRSILVRNRTIRRASRRDFRHGAVKTRSRTIRLVSYGVEICVVQRGREARGGLASDADNSLFDHEIAVNVQSQLTAGLTAPVRHFILRVATDPFVGAQNDTLAELH